MRSFVAVAAFEIAFDVPPRLNLALGRPARLSSTAHSGYSAASFATDGQTQMDDVIASGCAQTDVEAAPWLEVDLEHRAVGCEVKPSALWPLLNYCRETLREAGRWTGMDETLRPPCADRRFP